MPLKMVGNEVAAEIRDIEAEKLRQHGFTGLAQVWLGNEAGTVIVPPRERRHPAEAFYCYGDINGSRQVVRVANRDAALTFSNNDRHTAVWIAYPPGESILHIIGVASQNAKVKGPALPNQVQAAKNTFLTPDRFQMLRLSVAGELRVRVEAGWYYYNGLLQVIEAGELIDLTPYLPGTTGQSRIAFLGWTLDETVRVLQGTPFIRTAGDPLFNHFPTQPFEEGDLPLGGAILRHGQTALAKTDLLPYLPFFEATGGGGNPLLNWMLFT